MSNVSFAPIDKTLNPQPTITGRRSLDILQNSAMGKLLALPQKEVREMGLEYWICRSTENALEPNGVIAFRVTSFLYALGVCDRAFSTLPLLVKDKWLWRRLSKFCARFTKSMFIDKSTMSKYYVKGRDLCLNYAADFDKNMWLGLEARMFILDHRLRAWINYVYTSIATGKGISRLTRSRLLQYNMYINASGKRIKMTPLQFLLLCLDSLNTQLTLLARSLPAQFQKGFTADYMWSMNFKKEFSNFYDPAVIDDYETRIAKDPQLNGFCI